MLKLSFLNLFRRKTRTFLALLGIAIGVAAIISLVSAVDGAMLSFNDAISQIQGISIVQKDVQDQTFSRIKDEFVGKLENVQGVRTVVPEIWGLPSKLDGKSGGLESAFSFSSFIYGMDAGKYNRQRGNGFLGELSKGEFLEAGDTKKIVIGKTLADDMDKFIGSSLRINDTRFIVKGILKSENELYGGVIAMPLEDAREIVGMQHGIISSMTLELENPTDDKKIAGRINFLFSSELDAYTVSDFSDQLSGVLGNFRIAVFFVAAISAIVAGVGIINTILMSVLDRKTELGTLKATGWTKFEVVTMILQESVLLGIIGGISGVVLGILASMLLDSAGIPTYVSPFLLMQGFGFGLFTGAFAGIYPAWIAANMDPVEAMASG